MRKVSSSFWFMLVILVSALFAFLFYPYAKDQFGITEAWLFTVSGILVLWLIFFLGISLRKRK